MATRLLNLAALRALGITYSVQWLGKLEKRGEFPRRVKRTPLSQNTWREDEIERYLEAPAAGAHDVAGACCRTGQGRACFA